MTANLIPGKIYKLNTQKESELFYIDNIDDGPPIYVPKDAWLVFFKSELRSDGALGHSRQSKDLYFIYEDKILTCWTWCDDDDGIGTGDLFMPID